MKLGPSIFAQIHPVFLSSGGDLRRLRDFADSVMRDVVNPLLLLHGIRVRLDVDRWEDAPPQRAGDRVNDMFVERALASAVTIVLLRDELRSGTEEELVAILGAGDDGPQLCVLWFEPSDSADRQEIDRIKTLLLAQHDRVLWKDSIPYGDENPDEAFLEIVRVVVDVLLSATKHPVPEFVEEVRDASTA